MSAAQEAFGVSRRTLYRWKAALKAAGDNPAALIPKPPIAKRKRGKNRDPQLVKHIRELRTLYPNLGKERLHRLLVPWCAEQGITLPLVSTIGRIIAEAPDKMRLVPKRLDARARKTAAATGTQNTKAQRAESAAADPLGAGHDRTGA
nr:helix-turn-helix domain-containing protein [Hydrogenophilus thermoluteolus]